MSNYSLLRKKEEEQKKGKKGRWGRKNVGKEGKERKKENLLFVAFATFHAKNTPTMTKFKLLMCRVRMRCTSGSSIALH